MGRRELLLALQREGGETMAAIAAAAAAEEERLRAEAELRREGGQQEHELRRELLCSGRRMALVSKAAREAELIRLRTEHALSQRLYERARICLRDACKNGGERLFRALAAELPGVPWRSVCCSPADAAAASATFPGAAIIADAEISGGCRGASADGTLTVDNSMEKRLERAWPDLLPQLLAELRGRRL